MKKLTLNQLKSMSVNSFLLVIVIIFLLSACGQQVMRTEPSASSDISIIAYIAGWYHPLEPSTIPVHQLTHIAYAFALIKDGRIAENHPNDAINYKILADLKQRNNNLRILISIGGWAGSAGFSDMALTTASREMFISSVLQFLQNTHFDGVDLDWEYPGLPGLGNTCRPEDKENFTALLKEFRAALDKLGIQEQKKYLLSFAAGAAPECLAFLEMSKIKEYVDFINLMTYDFAGDWDATTGHHTNLFNSSLNPQGMSTAKAVDLFLAAGAPKEKLIVGLAFYGHGWQEVNPKNNGLFQPGKAYPGDFSYRALSQDLINQNGFKRYWDKSASAPFLWNKHKKLFITYEDPESLQQKISYIRKKGLTGVMFWEFHEDKDGELINTIYKNIHR